MPAARNVVARRGWQFECGEFLLPAGWKAREVPELLPEGDLAFYRGLNPR